MNGIDESLRMLAGALLCIIGASCSVDSRLLASLTASDLTFGVAPMKIAGLKLQGTVDEDTGIPTSVAVTPGALFGSRGSPERLCLPLAPTAGCTIFPWHSGGELNPGTNYEVLKIDLPADRFPSVLTFWWLWEDHGSPPQFSIFSSDAAQSLPLLSFTLAGYGVGPVYRPAYSVNKVNQLSIVTHTITGTEYVSSFNPQVALTPDTWNYLMLTFDALGRSEIFVNGVVGGSGQSSMLPDRAPGTAYRISFVNQYSTGISISDLRVFDQPLTRTQANGLYDGSWSP
jgi:hypothetical protein